MFLRRWSLPLLLLAWNSVFVGKVSAQTVQPLPIQNCLDSIAISETKEDGLRCVIAAADTGFKVLFTQMFNGNVYTTNLPAHPHSLVTQTGDSDISEVTYHSLKFALTSETVLDKAGKLLWLPADSVVELDVSREMRLMLQPVLTAFDLSSSDPAKRRSAAQLLGESRDLTLLPMLKQAAQTERLPKVKHLMDESVARLELFAPDASTRLAGAQSLEKLRGGNAILDLKSLYDSSSTEQDPAVRKAAMAAVKAIENWNFFTGILQNLFSSLSLGSILILMALGLSIIFGLMGVINMAHGEFMMIGAYATYIVQNIFLAHFPAAFGWFLAVSFPMAFLSAGLFGMLVETTIIKRLYGRPLETLLATWGLSLLMVQTARTVFGDLTAVVTPPFLGHGWEIFPQVVLPYNRIFIIGFTIVIVAGMSFLFYRTSLGMKVRAVTQNRSMSACLGVRTRRLDCITFGLGTGIAGLAGCALTQIGNVDPGMGQNYIVDSFMVVVTGGVGKLMGTVLAGLGIGTLNKFLEPIFQAVYAKVILLGLVILFLQRRPSGLFPAKGRHEDT